MIIFLSLAFPIIAVVAIYSLKRWDIANEEDRFKGCVYVGSTLFIILCISSLLLYGGLSKSRFNEVWNYKIVSIEHQQRWSEEQMRTETYPCGTDSKGNTTYCTRIYYVTEHYGPYWTIIDEYGSRHSIDSSTYEEWANLWKNERQTGVHNGSAAGWDTPITGKIFQANWTNKFEEIYPYEEIKTYQSKVRVCNTVFKWPEASEETKKRFPRPADQNNVNPIISYGPECDAEEIMWVRRANALLGKNCEVHLLILLFDAKEGAGIVTEVLNAWQGPNKNELVCFIGLNDKREVQWIEVHSWADDTTIHGLLVQTALQSKKFNAEFLARKSTDLIPRYWNRKKFETDFAYLSVPISKGWFIASIILSLGVSIGGIFFIDKEG